MDIRKRTGIVNEKILLGKIKEGCGEPLSPMSDMACKVRKKTSISACVIKKFFSCISLQDFPIWRTELVR